MAGGQGLDGHAVDTYLDIPVGSGLAKTLNFQLADGTPVDISTSTWSAEIVDTAVAVTVTQPAAHQLLLSAARASLDTGLKGLTGLRWQLWETDGGGTRRPRLAGPVNRYEVGYGEEAPGGTGDITVTVGDDGQVVQVAAVVAAVFAAVIDGGRPDSIYPPGTEIDGGGP